MHSSYYITMTGDEQLTNIKDCIARGFVKDGETPLEVAAQQLIKDKINVIHTIGGDDTNTQAAELSKYILEKHGGKVVVVGMPKTIDNDVVPILQTFGADTAAEQGASFFNSEFFVGVAERVIRTARLTHPSADETIKKQLGAAAR